MHVQLGLGQAGDEGVEIGHPQRLSADADDFHRFNRVGLPLAAVAPA